MKKNKMEEKLKNNIWKLYEKFYEAFGGDDPRFDNDVDTFLQWIDFEIEQHQEQ